MSTIADRCGHTGCDDECIDDYVDFIPFKNGDPRFKDMSYEEYLQKHPYSDDNINWNERIDIEVTEEGWEFLEDLYNNPTKEAIEEAKRIKEKYKDFDWDNLHEGVSFPMEDDE